MSAALAGLNDLTKSFNSTQPPALDSLCAEILPGRITGLVGPDGAGKTTLMRLMAGLLTPTRGTLTVCGWDVVRDAQRIHSEIGYMPQRFGLYEDLTVMENLRLHADLRGVVGTEREQVFERLLAFTDLARFQKRLAGKLSGGMKQKLGLACTLIRRPKLLLLDEPSVGVDPISRRELWRMVRELVDDETGVLWSTAYLDEAERCDEVLLLNAGKLLYTGVPRGLTDRVRGRSFQIQNIREGRRHVLTEALRNDVVRDGVVQGRNVRVVFAEGASPLGAVELGANPEAKVVSVEPRFEDAFVDILGGGPGGDSKLAQQMEQISDDGSMVVEAVGLTKRFGDFTAAEDISFSIGRGRIFGLLGPNGAGKSTTFKMMCGLLKPTAGTAHVIGLNLQDAPSQARARIGYMAQKFSLYGILSVRQNLEFFSGAYGLRGRRQRETLDRMIETFALQSYLNTSAESLPLGFKQRLALACAVMHDPVALFLDEPTSGVDPITRREFWTHINGMVEKGVTVVVTTHFMDEAEYCDEIALVYRGRIIATGSPDDLKDTMRTDQLQEPTLEDAFIALIERSDAEREAME
ncbi:TPA: multidrug ABC transporter ATP-binding protein [Candidatus Sumerlaeota bacterium]|jgi:ABC-2 type transport system ATP-binding protein|nr:multidrug ABC transporter ATP-binding protein [Candidatus Sumerlaeota bacterium]